MANLDGRCPVPGLDDAYIMCICRANLDAMGGQAMSTIGSHPAAVKRMVTNCRRIRKSPTLLARGPMPLADHLGMGITVEMLFNFLTARPRLKGEAHIQFNSMRCPRATYTLMWESLPIGVRESSTFATGSVKVTVTSCPTQQKLFCLFLRGAENRMATPPIVISLSVKE